MRATLNEVEGRFVAGRAKTLAPPCGPSRSPTGSSTSLDDQRRHIETRLTGEDQPDRGDVQAWDQIGRAIDARTQALGAAALADPGTHLTDRLGPPPPSGPARAAWARAGQTVDAYRDRYAISGPDPLGPRPERPDQARHHQHAETVLDITEHHLEHHLDRHQGLGLLV